MHKVDQNIQIDQNKSKLTKGEIRSKQSFVTQWIKSRLVNQFNHMRLHHLQSSWKMANPIWKIKILAIDLVVTCDISY
jgi:hypothetical protein